MRNILIISTRSSIPVVGLQVLVGNRTVGIAVRYVATITCKIQNVHMEKLKEETNMNSRYMTDDECIRQIYEQMNQRAVDSYKGKNETLYPEKFCSKCGRLLVCGSISYYEGFHMDSCE